MTASMLRLSLVIFIILLAQQGIHVHCQLSHIPRSAIVAKDNGYEGLLIAIEESVPEKDSATIIKRIQDYFMSASAYMLRATYRRLYFRSITILLPSNWKKAGAKYPHATGETLQRANVYVSANTQTLARSPYVRRSTRCGEPGEYMQLSHWYMMQAPTYVISRYGEPGATLVHEWAHLRWGVFDEYAIPAMGFPKFYFNSTGHAAPLKCGKYLNGRILSVVNFQNCPLEEDTGLPGDNCQFIVDQTMPGVNASIMFYHYIPKVITFCDNDENNHMTLHNFEAPSPQNDFCNGRSCWEVMRQHPDFANGSNPSIDIKTAVNTTPKYNIVHAQPKRIVVALDKSKSMRGVKLQKLLQAGAEYFRKVVLNNSKVALVEFSTQAETKSELIEVSSQAVREQLTDLLPRYATGGTAIGSSLQMGINLLEANGSSAEGGMILCVSDGRENMYPLIEQIKPLLLERKITVHTILISQSADSQLLDVATATKGQAYFDSGSIESTDLVDAFRTIASKDDTALPGAMPVQLLLDSVTVGGLKKKRMWIYVDDSVGRDTEFSFFYLSESFNFDVTIISPSGVRHKLNGDNTRHDKRIKVVTVSMAKHSEIGRWKVILVNKLQKEETVQILVTSKSPSDDKHPIRIRAFISHQTVDFNDRKTLKLIVVAELTRGYEPVLSANVHMRSGDGKWQRMYDNGIGYDEMKNDGIYTALLVKIVSNGLQSVKIKAVRGDSTRVIAAGAVAAYPVWMNETEFTFIGDNSTPFERPITAGAIVVKGWKPDIDLTERITWPPFTVKDLALAAASAKNHTVTLTWTSVGDFNDTGRAYSYILRYHHDIRILRKAFDTCTPVDNNDVLYGDLEHPKAPRRTERFVIRFPSTKEHPTYFFALKVKHNDTRISDSSNIVSAALPEVHKQTTATTTHQMKSASSANNNSTTAPPCGNKTTCVDRKNEKQPIGNDSKNERSTVLIAVKVGLGIGIPLLIILVAAITICQVCRKKSRTTRKHRASHDTAPA